MAKLNIHNQSKTLDFSNIQFGIEIEEYIYTANDNIRCISSSLEKVRIKSMEELTALTQAISQFNEASREMARTTKTKWKVKKLIKL